jgi:2-oxoglutarate dehydrogenase E2 component (dihydrolipoamide succinyltransferase)
LADVTLPSLGESVTEGIITQWFKKVGDVVMRDEALFEVSTDKVDSEMPSPATGVLVQILAAEGDTVETGAKVAVIDESADISSAGASAPAGAAPAAATPVAAAPKKSTGTGAAGVLLSPVVRRILADGEVEPSTVVGTGPGGAITRRDAEVAVSNGPTEDVLTPISNGRRRMGQHMVLSTQVAPHGFVAVEVDGTAFAKLDVLGRETASGALITDEMLVGLAAVRALKEFPFLNASFAGDDFIQHRTVNLGVMRSVKDDGMLVPVVHAANDLKLRSIAERLSDIDERVRTRQMTADDLLGGTFSVLGAPSEHSLFSTAIIIQPQVAVLTVGAVRATPVVVERDGKHEIAVGLRVVLGLSYDHRICEPVSAANFLERVGALLNELDVESER